MTSPTTLRAVTIDVGRGPCPIPYPRKCTLCAQCDSSCTSKLGTLFTVKYVLVSVKLVCVYVKLLKI
jgi:hypothetical protein